MGDPSAVYLSVTCPLGFIFGLDSITPGLVCQVIAISGWSRRFCPTPGESMRVLILCSSRCSSGPIPESISIWGDAIAPAARIISSPLTMKFSYSDVASTPVALGFCPVVSKRIFLTDTFDLMVRFSLCRESPRYPIAVDHLTPPGLFNGIGPIPVVSGAL